jgi:hypothetical protein
MQSSSSPLPIESYLYNLITISSFPPPGHPLSITTPSSARHTITMTSNWQFPLLDMPLGHLFMALDLKSIILLVACLYQEKRILLISKKKTLLFYSAQTLITLLYPLWWNYTYIPVLPDLLLNFITNERPYILGIHPSLAERDEVKNVMGKVVVANLDENIVSIPPDFLEPPDHEVLFVYCDCGGCMGERGRSGREGEVGEREEWRRMRREGKGIV